MRVLLITALILIGIGAHSQNCKNLTGGWQNELGSILQIDSISNKGEILGVYKSSTGVDGKTFDLQGFLNYSADHPDQKNLSFSVRWKGYGSITSWTGYCYQLENRDQIKTVWHLVRSGKEFDWERVITNSSTFKPLHPSR
tara:strand:+ start:1289 stop:1711 length:423 start_codon:yes stop_codon:yes gene_type:complete